jgi:general secretion pathway protein G
MTTTRVPGRTPEGRRPRRRAWSRRSAGFTLLELLVVLVILGLLAAIAAPRVMSYLGGAKTDTARIQIESLSTTLDLFRLDVGRYPTEAEGLEALLRQPPGAEGWNGPYVRREEQITDPWGRRYVYRYPGRHLDFDLYTLGADGAEGGEGENREVTNW